MKRIYFLGLLCLFFIWACEKTNPKTPNIVEVNSDYLGNWDGSDPTNYYALYIDDEGVGSYIKYDSEKAIDEANGPVCLEGNQLTINYHTFTVTEHPVTYMDTSDTGWVNEKERFAMDGITFGR